MGLVVEPDGDDFLRLAGCEQTHVVEPVLLAAGGRDRLPSLVACVEAPEARGAGVHDVVVLEPPEPRPATPCAVPDRLHVS